MKKDIARTYNQVNRLYSVLLRLKKVGALEWGTGTAEGNQRRRYSARICRRNAVKGSSRRTVGELATVYECQQFNIWKVWGRNRRLQQAQAGRRYVGRYV